MTDERHDELFAIYERQSKRAAAAAIVVLVAGAVGTFAAALAISDTTQPFRSSSSHDSSTFIAVMGVGVMLTAVMYVVVSAMKTHADVRSHSHLAQALAQESKP